MRNNFWFLILVVSLLSVSSLQAQRNGDQGYGVMIGNPSGFTAKVWLDDQWGIDGAIGVARGEFDIHISLLRHNFEWGNKIRNSMKWLSNLTKDGEFPFYYGMGPRLLFEEEEEFGIRFPVGLSYLSNESNWEVFTEFAPVLRLTQDTGFNGDFGIGVRYYFRSIRPRVDQNKE